MNNTNNNADSDFLLLKRRIVKDTSLDIHQYKNNYLKRRIDVRMRAKNAKNYIEYYRILTREPWEYNNLLKDLTINVTQFFRDPEVYDIIESDILPLIIYNNVKRQQRIIRILSVGCSSGEEPYSLAILIHNLLGEEFNNFQVSIYGFDIDEKSLNIARKGKYDVKQLENIRSELLKQYFKYDGEFFEVSENIRNMVRFKNQDIFNAKFGNHYNIIICRNVLIYFGKEMQAKLFMHFYNSLKHGGYLIIGKTETMVGEAKDRFIINNSRERIYQKPN
jgi:chemotaxis protein methyltransferase CheR